ncbi:MAG TPA: MmcQ/YjbR family DNA-binding protein [Thermoanaerobaculia bacterium]
MAKSASNRKIADALRDRALSYPETTEDFPWGESAFKVKGKTFTFMRATDEEISVTMKLPKSRDFALTLPRSEPSQYGMGKYDWVTMRPTAKTPLDVLFSLMEESFRANAPKRIVAQLERSAEVKAASKRAKKR